MAAGDAGDAMEREKVMSGVLYGLGVGPGDPELLTLKALRLLRSCPVVAYPAPKVGDSFARTIVADFLPDGVTEFAIRIPMRRERFPAVEVYDAAAETLTGHLSDGRDVAVLCEGDPFFYGSFMYLFGRLSESHRVEVVPGVSSLTACAAALESPLAARDDVLAVVPAPLSEDTLRDRLAGAEAAAIIKVGRHFGKVRGVLQDLGLLELSRYVERATLDNQKILPLSEVTAEAVPYFSMILMHRRGTAWTL